MFKYLLVTLCLFSALSAQGPDFSKPQTFLKYADALADDGDYYRAISEYKRVLFYFPQYDKKNWVYLQIGRMYYLGGRYEPAKDYLVPLTVDSVKEPQLPFYARNFLALTYYENNEFINSQRLFAELAGKKQSVVKPLDYRIYQILSSAQLNKFTDAKNLAIAEQKKLKGDDKEVYKDFFKRSIKVLDKAEHLSYKSSSWAIFWSAIFPGAGHLYLSQYDNALVSFLLVSGAGLLAADGFINERIVQAGIFTTLGTGFYIGQIYSSFRGVRKFNRRLGIPENKQLVREFKLLNVEIRRNFTF